MSARHAEESLFDTGFTHRGIGRRIFMRRTASAKHLHRNMGYKVLPQGALACLEDGDVHIDCSSRLKATQGLLRQYPQLPQLPQEWASALRCFKVKGSFLMSSFSVLDSLVDHYMDLSQSQCQSQYYLDTEDSTTKQVVVIAGHSAGAQMLPPPDAMRDCISELYRTMQRKLAIAIKEFLKMNPVDPPVDPPADEGVGNDDSPTANHIPIPSNAVVEGMPAKDLPTALKKAFEDFKTLDVVAGAASFTPSQRGLIKGAGEFGIPPLEEPFNQVVLVTDNGEIGYIVISAI
ncbi:hypothetical protein BDZ89DRAFT_1055456 [Hymenopellis radicata]|nr:hypothetical protein BDZ89DRAFT_1055456 [Hymenopellis radicata]